MITADVVRELLYYDQETGEFRWRVMASSRALVGDKAGSYEGKGYVQIQIRRRRYKAHRLAWLYVYGAWPPQEIDHINGVRDDNRIVNLRLATRTENRRNTRIPSTNTSGFKGVYWNRQNRKWVAMIRINKRGKFIGGFTDIEDAVEAYRCAAEKYFGEFANAGGVLKDSERKRRMYEEDQR